MLIFCKKSEGAQLKLGAFALGEYAEEEHARRIFGGVRELLYFLLLRIGACRA